jgi:hypothetical protein
VGLMRLYRSDAVRVTKVIGGLTCEITFDDGTVKPSVHIQNLRCYHERPDSRLGATNNVSTDNRSNFILWLFLIVFQRLIIVIQI